jgi:hypothetical protein
MMALAQARTLFVAKLISAGLPFGSKGPREPRTRLHGPLGVRASHRRPALNVAERDVAGVAEKPANAISARSVLIRAAHRIHGRGQGVYGAGLSRALAGSGLGGRSHDQEITAGIDSADFR